MTEAVVDDTLDDHTIVQPYRLGPTLRACDRLQIVACSSARPEARELVGSRSGISKEHQYADYQELIDRERPELVVIGTQPEQRAERAIYAAEHGVKAIYAEKAMAASMQEVDAVERNGVFFNLGSQRRWDPAYDKIKEVIDSGELGALKSLISHYAGLLFGHASHYFDLILRLNSDAPVAWVQAHLTNGDTAIDGDILREDPKGHGIIQFENGVTAYSLISGKGGEGEHEAICEHGMLTAVSNGTDWWLRRFDREGEPHPFPPFERASSTLRLVEDLVHSMDTGELPRGGVRVARASTELIFAFIESHRRGGARVELPLGDCGLKLQRDRPPRPVG